MKISVNIHPNSKQEKISKLADGSFTIHTKAQPHDNQANKAIIKLLADYFKIAPSLIEIEKGQSSKNKIIRIDN